MFKKLRELRLQNGLTIKDMANRLQISKPFYSQIENQNRRLSYDMAIQISEIFHMKPDDIFYDNYKRKESKKG